MDENQISYEEIDREIEERAAAKRRKLPHEIFDFAELIVITLAVLILLTVFLFRQTVVSGKSMTPTLNEGEHLVISDFFYTPKTGDIVVFQVEDEICAKYPDILTKNEPLIKRVIATEGQTVSISNGTVYVDGKALEEDYVLIDGSFPAGYYGKECVVPEGEVFVLGDHRNASSDSATGARISASIFSIESTLFSISARWPHSSGASTWIYT